LWNDIVERPIGPEITVVALNGKLALGRESQRIQTLMENLAQRGAKRVIFDLTGVTYIDSAGIGILAVATAKPKESGGTLAADAHDDYIKGVRNGRSSGGIRVAKQSKNRAHA